MATPLTDDQRQHLLGLLLALQHQLLALDGAQILQDGPPWRFDPGRFPGEIDRALAALGWRPGDPMPPGLPFEIIPQSEDAAGPPPAPE